MTSTALFGRLRVTPRSFRDRRLDGSAPTTQVHHNDDGPGLEIGPQIAPGSQWLIRVRIEGRQRGWRRYNLGSNG